MKRIILALVAAVALFPSPSMAQEPRGYMIASMGPRTTVTLDLSISKPGHADKVPTLVTFYSPLSGGNIRIVTPQDDGWTPTQGTTGAVANQYLGGHLYIPTTVPTVFVPRTGTLTLYNANTISSYPVYLMVEYR